MPRRQQVQEISRKPKTTPSFKGVFQFSITLKGTHPAIWRRIQVPDTYSFWDLHVAIQDSMGWKDTHLHQFKIHHPDTGKNATIGIPDEQDAAMFGDQAKVLEGWKQRLQSWFLVKGQSAIYRYDFGDNWEHEVVYENSLPREQGRKYPVCLEGENACPPEDCGGISGFYSLLESVQNPDDPDHKQMREWLGEDYNPDEFDSRKVKFSDPQERWRLAFE